MQLGAASAVMLHAENSIPNLFPVDNNDARLKAVYGVLVSLIGQKAEQIRLRFISNFDRDRFSISAEQGKVLIEGNSSSAMLAGANWYLRYVAGVNVSWNGDSLNMLSYTLPLPSGRIEHTSAVKHRFALNDTNDGYTGPYWQWEQWKHLIDVLALHGINEVLVYMGAEAVYQQTFKDFGYSAEEMRRWLPMPAHQPWWLLQNMTGGGVWETTQHWIDERAALGRRICDYMRALDMTPVLPGYYGSVPDEFSKKNLGAHIFVQGKWGNFKRLDWLDPTTEMFACVAAHYYEVQDRLLGPSSMYKMDPLHEGGRDSGINLAAFAGGIESALAKAHPDATWAILGWIANPRKDLLSGIKNKNHVLILDGISDRAGYIEHWKEWDGTPIAFGTIWNFGGHSTIGANLSTWNERFFSSLSAPNVKITGLAMMPEAACNNPAAFEFLTELAWRDKPVDLQTWFKDWSAYRYGKRDFQSAKAWDVLRQTAYNTPANKSSEAHDNLFSAQPSLLTRSSCIWSPKEPRYNLTAFAAAVKPLLDISEDLRRSSAYQYDVVDVVRQAIANKSRWMLPEIESAYVKDDLRTFQRRTALWLRHIELLNELTATVPDLLLGRWVADAARWGTTVKEKTQLEFEARAILVQWEPYLPHDPDIRDYANREWNGLLQFYYARWQRYFLSLETSLKNGMQSDFIDWPAMSDAWEKKHEDLPTEAQGNAWEIAQKCLQVIDALNARL